VQVLTNLLQNALRHGNGRVVVHGSRDNGSAIVEVSDEGAGIPLERADEVFEPFARWSSRSDSTGLGLPISRRIVEAHGGAIQYRPPADERPHAFVVTLPAQT
jgi:signal transduction histidine kinase